MCTFVCRNLKIGGERGRRRGTTSLDYCFSHRCLTVSIFHSQILPKNIKTRKPSLFISIPYPSKIKHKDYDLSIVHAYTHTYIYRYKKKNNTVHTPPNFRRNRKILLDANGFGASKLGSARCSRDRLRQLGAIDPRLVAAAFAVLLLQVAPPDLPDQALH